MNKKKSHRNLTLKLNSPNEANESYHSSKSSKLSDKESKIISKKINRAKTNKFKKADIYEFSKSSKEKEKEKEETITNNITKFSKNSIKKRSKTSINKLSKKKLNISDKKEEKEEKKEKKGKKGKKEKKVKIKDEEKFVVNKNLLKVQNPVVIDELPKQKHTCFLGSKSHKSIYKLIQIYIFHREEIFLIKINNGLTINNLIEQILQKIKIIKEELELFLIYDNLDINACINSYKNINYFFKNIPFKRFDKYNKIKKTNKDLKLLDDNKKYDLFFDNSKNESKNNTKQMLLIFPDIDNKYKNVKINDLLKNKMNCYIKANQVSKNKYNANYNYRNEIKNLNNNSFITNINKEIEKNNLILSKNNYKTIDINTGSSKKELGIKNNYKNIVIVEGLNLISDFLQEIESFLKKNEIKDNYNYQNIGKAKYSFGFQRKDVAYDFHKFVSMLQLVNKKFFGIRCKIKYFNSINNFKSNNKEKINLEKKNFYFNNKFDNNNNFYSLKKNLDGPINTYFINKGQKNYITNEIETESMKEIVEMNRFKFKMNNDMNYVNIDNFNSIPLI